MSHIPCLLILLTLTSLLSLSTSTIPSLSTHRHLTQNGLHGKVHTHISLKATAFDSIPRHVVLFEKFSKHVFLDRFELSERERILKTFRVRYYTDESVDVELPSYRVQQGDFHVDFALDVPREEIREVNGAIVWNCTLEYPIHFRYHAPLVNSSYVYAALPERPYLVALVYDPELMWPRHFLNEEKMVDAMIAQYSSLEYTKKIEIVHATSVPQQKELVARIPVGRLEHQKVVSPVTLFVSSLAALLLCICIMIYASRTS